MPDPQQLLGFPREEKPICDGLVAEIAKAQAWPEIVNAARALLNVRAVAEQVRIGLMVQQKQAAAQQPPNFGPPQQGIYPQAPQSRTPVDIRELRPQAGTPIEGLNAGESWELPFDV